MPPVALKLQKRHRRAVRPKRQAINRKDERAVIGTSGHSTVEALRSGSADTTAPATRKRRNGYSPNAGNVGHTQRRWRIAEGKRAPGEADRRPVSAAARNSNDGFWQRWRRRASGDPDDRVAIAAANGRALEVVPGAAAITGQKDTDGWSRRRPRSPWEGRQMRGTRHDGLDERGEASQQVASSLRPIFANKPSCDVSGD